MKKVLLSIAAVLTCSTLFAQHSLEQLWQSDSLTLKSPESVLYDPISNSLYVSSSGSGAIVRMDTDGKVTKSDWVTGLKFNMGSALFNGLLYTVESSGVAVIDVDKASIVKRIPIEGAGMLNDLAVGSKGVFYVSDTRAGKLYRIEGDNPVLYVENLPGANGLLTINEDLYVVTSTSLQKVNADKEITKIADGFENGLDGIVMVGADEFVISNYKGILYYVSADGTKQLLLDTRSVGTGANDISYDSKTKTVYVPSFPTNRVIAYKLK